MKEIDLEILVDRLQAVLAPNCDPWYSSTRGYVKAIIEVWLKEHYLIDELD